MVLFSRYDQAVKEPRVRLSDNGSDPKLSQPVLISKQDAGTGNTVGQVAEIVAQSRSDSDARICRVYEDE